VIDGGFYDEDFQQWGCEDIEFGYRVYYLSLVSLLSLTPKVNAEIDWPQYRWRFKEAYQALLAGNLENFKRLSAQIHNYPIAHYLQFLYLKSHLEQQKLTAIKDFLHHYPQSPASEHLRRAWLTQLAKKQDWDIFLKFYTPQKSTTLQCHYLHAQLEHQNPTQATIDKAKELWLVGHSQPHACDPIFEYLYKTEALTDESFWQRIRLAMQKGQFQLARYLAQKLPQADQQWFARWQQMHEQPATALKQFDYPDTALAREILVYGLKRLARQEVAQAHQHWQRYQSEYALQAKDNAELFRYLALEAAEQNHPQAAKWLAAVDSSVVNEAVYRARFLIALTKSNWQAIIDLVRSFSPSEQQHAQWQYWLARALEQQEHIKKAEQLFKKLAQQRDYYGFLAANRLGENYHFNHQKLELDPSLQKRLLNQERLIRARELYFVGLADYGREEWQTLLAQLTDSELQTVALLAHEWGWHDRAIVALAKAQTFDALDIRFPLPFYDIVLTQAQQHQLKPAWIYAVIRQESAFQVDAKSVSNALGLMQLLPSTAREVAANHSIKIKNDADILVPEINIRLGTGYLSYLMKRFKHNHLLATAAYNAGPSRSKRWAAQHTCLSPDIWVELIPFTQTRDYVQRV
ncbi:MAG: transglycosylase SLT domain-containing protein, partial [Pseudomonadota bacterium]|nr:transglycosylase SLT domain-containing protein [Pseudomonadota bacterium]